MPSGDWYKEYTRDMTTNPDIIKSMETIVIDSTHQEFDGKRYGLHKGNRYYKRTKSVNGTKSTVFLHREVWEYHNGKIPEGMMIDHIDRDKSNNSISNLRLVNAKENRANISEEHKEKYRQHMIKYNSLKSGKWWQDERKKAERSLKLSESWKNREPIEKKCLVCATVFYAKHNAATYCSKECRQENYFRRGVKLWNQKITK